MRFSLFYNPELEKLREENRLLRMQNLDLMERGQKIEQTYMEERGKLIDKIIALSNPPAYAMLNPPPRREAPAAPPVQRSRPSWPGFMPYRRPPVPRPVEEPDDNEQQTESS